MGICSDYIQAQGVNSHTIVEIHPQIIEKLKVWADGKSNVTIVEGDWSSIELGDYDGIFLDTFGDDNLDKFKDFVSSKAKSGAKVTYWNNYEKEGNQHNFSTISHEAISVTPETNQYSEIEANYYMPKVIM